MLLLKLTLVPAFLYLLALVARHWGPQRAGWMAGLPVVAGPILWLLMQEHGPAFAASAALQAIAAIAASELFNLIYARLASRFAWPLTLMFALCGWLLGACVLQSMTLTLATALAMAVLAVLINSVCLPRPALSGVATAVNETLGLRMLAAAVLTLLVSLAASHLGAGWSGMLAVFPLLAVVMAVATQRAQGVAATQALLRGMLLGRLGFTGFCLALLLLLPRLDGNLVFLLAACTAIGLQLLSRRLLLV
ncbi:hypothetical protein [Aquitalea sp. LB_tupeE]|uniref:hypothetical protein n=1 Tax=Aquitalea sp. LB_tupeE TaxID=2748078 RepID=UPI0015B93CA4|nr:hypothetical protein [Aquitalea sp. LB_tupeE]NWK77472.1 hypothetical protein [Aquitalea sp. LB_tupeE]